MTTKKYRLGNQKEEFELKTEYVGWVPIGFENWNKWWMAKENKKHSDRNWQIGDPDPTSDVTLISPIGEQATFLLEDEIIIDAFMEVYSEERFKMWWQFFIVADPKEPKIKFIIPMH